MLLTEEEAKKKMCCKVFPRREESGTLITPACMGSECMGWRWFDSLPVKDGTQNRRGLCGLAGRVTE